MAKKHTNLLGIAVTERSVQITQCHGSGSSIKAGRRSSFEIDGADAFASPELLGRQLAEHLKQEGYTAKHAAVGLSSRWLLPRVMSVVKADEATTAGMIRLRIEKEFAGGQGDLVFDYQDAPAQDGQRGLLLVGLASRRLDQVREAFDASGLTPVWVGSTALAAASGGPDGLTVVLERDGATAVSRHHQRAAHFAPIACEPLQLEANDIEHERLAAGALRHAATAMGPHDAASRGVHLVDTVTLTGTARAKAAAMIGDRLGAGCESQTVDPAQCVAKASGDAATINLLRSKLTPKPARRVPIAMRWLIRAAVLILIVGGAVGYFWVDANRRLTDLQREYDTLKDSATRLQQVRQDTRAARGWFDNRPPVLDCLLELTHTFPVRGRIWVTGLSLGDDTQGVINCRADDEQTMWRYITAMTDSPSLTDVVLRQQNTAGRAAGDVVFEVTFTYVPPQGEAQ